jgi:hypothetical protein
MTAPHLRQIWQGGLELSKLQTSQSQTGEVSQRTGLKLDKGRNLTLSCLSAIPERDRSKMVPSRHV